MFSEYIIFYFKRQSSKIGCLFLCYIIPAHYTLTASSPTSSCVACRYKNYVMWLSEQHYNDIYIYLLIFLFPLSEQHYNDIYIYLLIFFVSVKSHLYKKKPVCLMCCVGADDNSQATHSLPNLFYKLF